jgi:hypothetical protein
MAGTQTYISTKSGSQLLYLTNGLAVFNTLPKCSLTGERIEGPFINSAFKPKLRAHPSFAEELVQLAGEVSTEAKVRAAFEKIRVRLGKAEAKAAPKKAKATAKVAKAPKQETMAKMPTADELNVARFEAMERMMMELREQMAGKVA